LDIASCTPELPGSAAGSRGISDPALLTRIMNEVPLVVGVKHSAADLKLFASCAAIRQSAGRIGRAGSLSRGGRKFRRTKTSRETSNRLSYGRLYRQSRAVTVLLARAPFP
jgi:hypothetical protein